jgi:acyl-CoA thioesterase II
MGDLAVDTAVEPLGGGRYRASVSSDWEIWGPCGGYVAALALRAAGAESPLARPASFYCHYLSVASFAPAELEVTALRAGRTVVAQRVAMAQEGTPVLEAMIWSVGDVEGLQHDDAAPPDVPSPAELPQPAPLPPRGDAPRYAYWDNFDQRLLESSETWPPPGPLPPSFRRWMRCRPTATFADPWVDAARSLIMLDVGSWPAGSRPHAYANPPYIAPSLDLYTAFQQPGSDSAWVLLDAHAPIAHGGLLSWTGRLWSDDGRLLASGGGQAVFRHT